MNTIINELTTIFTRHAWALIPVMLLNWTIALALAYAADMTTGAVSVIAAISALVFMFWGTMLVGFANIEARWRRKAGDR